MTRTKLLAFSAIVCAVVMLVPSVASAGSRYDACDFIDDLKPNIWATADNAIIYTLYSPMELTYVQVELDSYDPYTTEGYLAVPPDPAIVNGGHTFNKKWKKLYYSALGEFRSPLVPGDYLGYFDFNTRHPWFPGLTCYSPTWYYEVTVDGTVNPAVVWR